MNIWGEEQVEEAREWLRESESDFYALIFFDLFVLMFHNNKPMDIAQTIADVYVRNEIAAQGLEREEDPNGL